ncbi:MAG: hypothetical protein LBH25_15370 [Fibromonadaceae bacterium]|jgi:hypothetical protein|nr:hypothetical protein [Fibromonadaceae bacterium]
MKTTFRFLFAVSTLLTMALTLSCSNGNSSLGGDSSEKRITVTGIPAKYNGQEACFAAGPITGEGCEGCERISGGKLEAALLGDESEKPWTGTGLFPAFLYGDDFIFIYTDGKTFDELQIDACVFLDEEIDEMPVQLFNKMPKISFLSELTEVEFSKFKVIDESTAIECMDLPF